MPPKDGKELKVILDNLQEFSEKLLSRIENEKKSEREQLLKVLEAAKTRYKGHGISSWFYQYTRTRGDEVNSAVSAMEAFPDSYHRVSEFQLLISQGKWEHGSYNYYLFDELIKSISGYQPLSQEITGTVIKRVKELVSALIDNYLKAHEASQKEIAQRAAENARIQQSMQESSNAVLVTHDLQQAKNSATEHANVKHFCLDFNDNQWTLLWVVSADEIHALTPQEGLAVFLKEKDMQNIETLSALRHKMLKNECLKTREDFLEKKRVLVQTSALPVEIQSVEKMVCESRLTESFLLYPGEKSQLFWVDSYGKVSDLNLASTPQFSTWLTNRATFDEEDMLRLKAFLLTVVVPKTIEIKPVIQKLDKFFSAKQHSKREVVVNKLDMSQFEAIERCLKRRTHTDTPPLPPRKLILENYPAITSFFAHKGKATIENNAVNSDVIQENTY